MNQKNKRNIRLEPNAALLLIDIQKGFENTDYWGEGRNNPEAEQKASTLLNLWRQEKRPVFHIQHKW